MVPAVSLDFFNFEQHGDFKAESVRIWLFNFGNNRRGSICSQDHGESVLNYMIVFVTCTLRCSSYFQECNIDCLQ